MRKMLLVVVLLVLMPAIALAQVAGVSSTASSTSKVPAKSSAPTSKPPAKKKAPAKPLPKKTSPKTSPKTATTTIPAPAISKAATSTPATSTPAASIATTSRAAPSKAPAGDTTPPIRSGGAPGGTLPPNTERAKVLLVTNEPARCYWSNFPGTPFQEMMMPFSTTGGTKHSYAVSVYPMGAYSFYAKCRDYYLNANQSDYPILFSVEHQTINDKEAPRVRISFPTEGDTVVEGITSLSVAAADNASVAGVNFFLNGIDLQAEDGTFPFTVTLLLKKGTYQAYATARDAAGNRATSPMVTFFVIPKPPAALAPYNPNVAAVVYAVPSVFRLFLDLLGL